MARSVLAILLGYLTFGMAAGLLFQLSGRDPYMLPDMWFLVFSILYGIAFGLLGGYVAALVARRRELAHAVVVGVVIGVGAVVSIVIKTGSGSLWSPISALVLMAPASVLGGYLRARSVKRIGSGADGV